MNRLKKIRLKGYKSFRNTEIEFGKITVLLGANGTGKSNLVSFFRMLNFMTTNALQNYIGRSGSADSLLHYGHETTPHIDADVEFIDGSSTVCYTMRLSGAAPDTLIFTDEKTSFHRKGFPEPKDISLGAGHKETLLREAAEKGDKTCKVLWNTLSRCQVFQFHDTSEHAKIRKSGYVEDVRYLRADAGNLAAFLYVMKKNHPDHYETIVDTIRLAFPAFGSFDIEPSKHNDKYVLLNWREKERSDYLFGPHQLSDGTLRFMSLVTLLLQPSEDVPTVIVLDEPELGLHPYAITVFAGLVKSVSVSKQVVLATQSTRLIDEFALKDIVVFEHDRESGTECKRLDTKKLSEWIKDYSLSELWEKNILGGRP
jgi:predicted ATPase